MPNLEATCFSSGSNIADRSLPLPLADFAADVVSVTHVLY